MKSILAAALRYRPLTETADVRHAVESARIPGHPYCPDYEGDFLYSLIRAHECRACLEMGFYTGSTALYLSAAVADRGGQVTSVGLDGEENAARGRRLLADQGHGERHRLFQENSNRVVPELFLAGERFDFVYMDGWKTFDHLAFEIYFINRMLETGGVIAFDDSHMPSVRQAIRLLTRYYGYEEVDYAAHNQTRRLRVYQVLTRRSPWRPYRALVRTLDADDQPPSRDWNFYRRI